MPDTMAPKPLGQVPAQEQPATPPQVSVGVTTKVGWGAMVLLLLPTIVKSIEGGVVAWNGPAKWLAVAGIILGAITQIGRYAQAAKLLQR